MELKFESFGSTLSPLFYRVWIFYCYLTWDSRNSCFLSDSSQRIKSFCMPVDSGLKELCSFDGMPIKKLSIFDYLGTRVLKNFVQTEGSIFFKLVFWLIFLVLLKNLGKIDIPLVLLSAILCSFLAITLDYDRINSTVFLLKLKIRGNKWLYHNNEACKFIKKIIT